MSPEVVLSLADAIISKEWPHCDKLEVIVETLRMTEDFWCQSPRWGSQFHFVICLFTCVRCYVEGNGRARVADPSDNYEVPCWLPHPGPCRTVAYCEPTKLEIQRQKDSVYHRHCLVRMEEDLVMIGASLEVLNDDDNRHSLWIKVSGLAHTMQAIETFLSDHQIWLRGFQAKGPGPQA